MNPETAKIIIAIRILARLVWICALAVCIGMPNISAGRANDAFSTFLKDMEKEGL